MEKIDYKKELQEFYRASAKRIDVVQVPKMNYLMIDGSGPPASQEYTDAVEALYTVAYTLKFMIKKGPANLDYGVLPLEGLWWAEDMSDFENDNKDK